MGPPLPNTKPPTESNKEQASNAETPFLGATRFPYSQQPPLPANFVAAPPLHGPQVDQTVYIHPGQQWRQATGAATGVPVNSSSLPAPGLQQNNNCNPHASQVPSAINRWNTDLFGCFEDPTLTLMTFCFPCVTFGQIAEIIDEGQTSCATNGMLYGLILFLIGLPCLISCGYRTKLRNRFGLDEVPAPDWLVHCFCEYCALCQAYRELNARQLNPALGWLGNQRQAMTPPTAQVMMPRI